MSLSIFTAFLKNKNIIFKIRRSKVTDYAALNIRFRAKGIFLNNCNQPTKHDVHTIFFKIIDL